MTTWQEQAPPCQLDFEATGREWTADAPPRTRAELVEMATLCAGCPLKDACFEQGKAGQLDSEGRWRGHSTGIWGGYLWRRGRAINPLPSAIEGATPQSVYYRVHWDRVRGQWKAQAEVRDSEGNPFKRHLGYFHDEDEAGRAVYAWENALADGRDVA